MYKVFGTNECTFCPTGDNFTNCATCAQITITIVNGTDAPGPVECSGCNIGYYPVEYNAVDWPTYSPRAVRCYKCDQSCGSCYGPTDRECSSCNTGYFVTSEGTCQKLVQSITQHELDLSMKQYLIAGLIGSGITLGILASAAIVVKTSRVLYSRMMSSANSKVGQSASLDSSVMSSNKPFSNGRSSSSNSINPNSTATSGDSTVKDARADNSKSLKKGKFTAFALGRRFTNGTQRK